MRSNDAVFLGFLKGKRIEREIRAAIVGQHDDVKETVEDRFYAGSSELIDAMREALTEHIPGIDWIGSAAGEKRTDNVVPLRAAKGV